MERGGERHPLSHGGTALADVFGRLAAALALVAFFTLFLLSLFRTCAIDPARYYEEHILFLPDSFVKNALGLSALAGCVYLTSRFCAFLVSRNLDRTLLALSLLFVFVFGAIWTRAAVTEPVGDSAVLTAAAREFLRGDFSALAEHTDRFGAYYRYYPFQLGTTCYFAALQAVFGEKAYAAMALFNALLLVAGYAAILYITREAFADRRVTALTALLFLLFPQAVFFCTFLYGSMPAFALSLSGTALTLRGLSRGKLLCAAAALPLLCAAVVLKQNAMIPAVACAILLLLSALSRKRLLPLALALLAVLLPLLSVRAVTNVCARRAGTELGGGAPLSLWLLIGLSESERAPGWHVAYVDSYDASDPDALPQRLDPLLSARKAALSDPAAAFDFFSRKLSSQWDEPTFESVWVSRAGRTAADNRLEAFIWAGESGGWLFTFSRYFVPFVYGGFVCGLAALLRKGRARFFDPPGSPAPLALPLIALGAFLFHLLFEAKSQYAVLYLPMLFPTVSFLFFQEKEKKGEKAG